MILTILAVVFVFSVLIIIHEWGHFIVAKRNGVKVERFSIGFGPKIFGITRGDTEYKVSLLPLGGYVKMAGMADENMDTQAIKGEPWEFNSKTVWQRLKIVSAGPVMNFVLALVIFIAVYMVGVPVMTNKIGEVKEGFPAAAAQLQTGDQIVAIDGAPVKNWNELVKIIYQNPGKELNLTIQRAEKQFSVALTPKEEKTTDVFGKEHTVGLIGIMPTSDFQTEKSNPLHAIWLGTEHTIKLTAMTYKGIFLLATGQVSPKNLGGPLMIAQLAGKEAKEGWLPLLYFIALISINLAVLNFLPIPILDGGHAFFLIVEAIKGSPVSVKAQDLAQKIGLGLLLALIIFATYNDILRFLGKS